MTPAVFVSHGMPAIVVQPGPTHQFFRGLGQTFDRPEAVICVSAHWEAVRPMLTTAPPLVPGVVARPVLLLRVEHNVEPDAVLRERHEHVLPLRRPQNVHSSRPPVDTAEPADLAAATVPDQPRKSAEKLTVVKVQAVAHAPPREVPVRQSNVFVALL